MLGSTSRTPRTRRSSSPAPRLSCLSSRFHSECICACLAMVDRRAGLSWYLRKLKWRRARELELYLDLAALVDIRHACFAAAHLDRRHGMDDLCEIFVRFAVSTSTIADGSYRELARCFCKSPELRIWNFSFSFFSLEFVEDLKRRLTG